MTTLMDKNTGCFMDTDCTIEIQGKKFTSGGAFIGINKKTGKMGGGVYGNLDKNIVSNWDGTITVKANFGKPYLNKKRVKCVDVWFMYQNRKFKGCLKDIEWNEYINVKEIKA